MSVYSTTPGPPPPPTGPITTDRMSPAGDGTRTSSSRSFTGGHPTRETLSPLAPARRAPTGRQEYNPGSDHGRGFEVDNPIERPLRALDAWQQRHRVTAVIFAVVKKFGDDQAGNYVAQLT